MATQGKEFFREHYEEDRWIYKDVQDPGSRGVTEYGRSVLQEECQSKLFRFANRDDAPGYGVRSVGETGQSARRPTCDVPDWEDRTLNVPDGYWRVERMGGLLPPMIGVRKHVRGERGETRVGPVLRWPFRLEDRVEHVALTYDPPFSSWVDELRPGEPGLWLGTATLGGRPLGRFRMVRIG